MAGSELTSISCLKIKPYPLHQSCFLFATMTQKLIYDVTQWHTTLSVQSIGYWEWWIPLSDKFIAQIELLPLFIMQNVIRNIYKTAGRLNLGTRKVWYISMNVEKHISFSEIKYLSFNNFLLNYICIIQTILTIHEQLRKRPLGYFAKKL